MSILLVGSQGQVGSELRRLAEERGLESIALSRSQLDLVDESAVLNAVDSHAPSVVINAAAYTAVDRAEEEQDLARRVNADGPAFLAKACAGRGIPLFHISTDYVFDGESDRPYAESEPPSPLGQYGISKAAGEQQVRDALADHLILRVSWVFSEHGGNFVKTMLRLAGEREELRVVADQHGCPTSARSIAAVLLDQAVRYQGGESLPWGTYHFCNAPATSWHGFAEAIIAEGRRHTNLAVQNVEPIPSSDYPTPAPRPKNSVLDTTQIQERLGVTIPEWGSELAQVVRALL